MTNIVVCCGGVCLDGVNLTDGNNASAIVKNYYNFLQESKEVEEGEVDSSKGEQILLSEIEKFRNRQMERDKQLEDQRRSKIKDKIRQLQEAKKNAVANAANATATAPSASTPTAAAAGAAAAAAGDKRKLTTEEDSNELEAKRRRKLQVLQMLSADAVEVPELKQTGPFTFSLKKDESSAGLGIASVSERIRGQERALMIH